ncbi:MAG: beta-N-acetylglucosaminidase domain-containing protein [Kiritimatiellia bacterium]
MKTLMLAMLAAAGTFAAHAKTPAVPFRGVVEGYYGRPWGTEGRLSLLKFMGEHGMNVFIYGPKDDPYHHSKWREAYPAAEMKDFDRLLKVAKANGINFYWAIHLGGGFRKGVEDDYRALFAKLGRMYDGGFRSFAVFFDDFGGADAEFHAEICNRIVAEFLDRKKDCAPLIMCPNVYWGSGHPYQKTLGAKLDTRVHIMWTGRGICSDITKEAVRQITEDFRRPPYIWWNWPVNDYCRSHLLLGRTYGLDTGTYAGFVSNPMENCEASKIALYGIAKWCADPDGFDSGKCWEESFAKLYKDPEVARAMRVFAAHNSDQGPNGHGYRREESVEAAPLCAQARAAFKASGALPAATAGELRKLFREVGKAARTLQRKLPKGRYDLGWELEGWLEAEGYLMAEGLKALDLLDATDRATEDALMKEVRGIRRQADAACKRHQEKFAAATFANDRGWMKRPDPSARELAPVVKELLEGTLRRIYATRTGQSIDAVGGFSAFSEAKSLPQLLVSLDDNRYAGIVRVLEPKEIKPGESFGIRVPAGWETDYFHAKLGSAAPAQAGLIEVSRDGATWRKLETRNGGENMETPLKVQDGWRWARYRNTSDRPVSVRINQFKFDIRGAGTVVDDILDALVK